MEQNEAKSDVTGEDIMQQLEVLTTGANSLITRVNEQGTFLQTWLPKLQLFEIMFQHFYTSDEAFKAKLDDLFKQLEAQQNAQPPKSN